MSHIELDEYVTQVKQNQCEFAIYSPNGAKYTSISEIYEPVWLLVNSSQMSLLENVVKSTICL